jgi:hypothetical protein
MNFSDIISSVAGPAISFAQSNPLVATAVVAFLVFLIYRRPFFFLVIFLIGLLVIGALYVIMNASSSGVSAKKRMIREGGLPQSISRPAGPQL